MKISVKREMTGKDALMMLASGFAGAVASRWLVPARRGGKPQAMGHRMMHEMEPERDLKRQTVTANRLNVVDESGRTRAVLGVNSDGITALQFNDQAGNVRLLLNLAEDGTPGVLLFDPGEVLRASLFIGENNPVAELRLRDQQGSERVHMAVTPEGEPELELRDGNGRHARSRA